MASDKKEAFQKLQKERITNIVMSRPLFLE